MSANRRKVLFTVGAALLIPLLGWWLLLSFGAVGPFGRPVRPPFNMSDRIATIEVVESDTGELVAKFDGSEIPLTADEFFAEVHARQEGRLKLPSVFRKLDITSKVGLFWVAFGFLAQGVFAGRMIVQWYASEKAKASIVPNVFWWMSLVGSSMCIIYFIWRKEPVGIMGQATGWIIYVRNLWMIYGKPKDCP